MLQSLRRGVERPFRGKCADVQFINHLALESSHLAMSRRCQR